MTKMAKDMMTNARKDLPTTPMTDYRRFVLMGFTAVALSFGGFGGWAALAPIDSGAVAPAQVAVDTNRKPLQHLEGGIIREILVRESQRVSEGDVLFRLEPTQARANAELYRKQLDAAMALEARLVAEQGRSASIAWPRPLLDRRGVPEVAAAIIDQQRQFDDRRRSLNGQTRILEARIEQTTREMKGRQAVAKSQNGQIRSVEAEYAKVSPLAERGLYPVNKRLVMERDLLRLKGELGVTEAEIARGEETVREARLQIEQLTHKFEEDIAQLMGDTRSRLSDIRERLAMADDVLTRVEIKAPRSGIVQAMKVFAAGTVVKAGETIAELVPVDDTLILTARVSPLDVDSVRPGQKTTVRFQAFSNRLAKPIFGEVATISADSLFDETTRQPYFSARIIVDLKSLPADLSSRIVPGMPADVLIATGERTLLAYLMGPLLDSISRGFREK